MGPRLDVRSLRVWYRRLPLNEVSLSESRHKLVLTTKRQEEVNV